MSWFGGLHPYRYNRLASHQEWFDRRQDSWALNYAHRGRLSFAIDGGPTRILQAPVAYWTWPGPRWTYGPADADGFEHVFVSWRGERPQAWVRGGLFPSAAIQPCWLTITDPVRMIAAFDDLHQLLDERPWGDPAIAHASESLLLQLHQQPPPAPPRSLAEAVAQRVASLRAEPGRALDLMWEAEQLGCTPVHLRRLWKAHTGLPPKQWLQKLRLDRAAQALRSGHSSVAEIAAEAGYANPSLFSRLFRLAKGLPPGRYRRAFRSVD